MSALKQHRLYILLTYTTKDPIKKLAKLILVENELKPFAPTYHNRWHYNHKNEKINSKHYIRIFSLDNPHRQSNSKLHCARSIRIAIVSPILFGLFVRKSLVSFGELFKFLLVSSLVRMHGLTQLAILFLYFFVGGFVIKAEYVKWIPFFVFYFDLRGFVSENKKYGPCYYKYDFSFEI